MDTNLRSKISVARHNSRSFRRGESKCSGDPIGRACFVMFAACFSFMAGGCGDVVASKERQMCDDRLTAIYISVHEYTKTEGRLPRDSDGDVSLTPLLCDHWDCQYCLDKAMTSCPCDGGECDAEYVVNQKVQYSDIMNGTDAVVIRCNCLHGEDRDIILSLHAGGWVSMKKVQ